MKSSGFYPQRQHSDSSHTNPCTFFSSLTYLRALKKHEFLYKSKFLITQWTFLSHNFRCSSRRISLFLPEVGVQYMLLKVKLVKEEFDEDILDKKSAKFRDLAKQISEAVSIGTVEKATVVHLIV